ncbi:MAG TPA: DUF1385 domain-containing protein [Candidatus Limnocylindria bacterium]|nr:DUF1385 domain-containing protein [Candidatus Limnocylindria bacterium]
MPAPTAYGGQAVIEGVVIRGKRTLAMACRKPDGAIYRYREALRSPLLRPGPWRWPFVRGVVVLWESLSHGMRMLMRSAELQMPENEEMGKGGTAAMIVAVGIALVLFIGIPYAVTALLRGALGERDLTANVVEGVLRLVLFLGYLGAISLMPDIRRVFAYHGAEHMTIHAFEHGEALVPDRVRPYPTAHPRCGTAFLLIVVVIAIASFAFIPRVHPLADLAVRLALVIPVAAVSYEVLKLGAKYEHLAPFRALVAPGLFLQRITTRRPDDGMIEVAIASLEEALAGDAEAQAA